MQMYIGFTLAHIIRTCSLTQPISSLPHYTHMLTHTANLLTTSLYAHAHSHSQSPHYLILYAHAHSHSQSPHYLHSAVLFGSLMLTYGGCNHSPSDNILGDCFSSDLHIYNSGVCVCVCVCECECECEISKVWWG